ncbi:hypothetical protein DJFAAGMI_01284 [Comamonas sp. PE63]|uniref:Uncharacterized protein n=2 Tax=Comamonas brasiliensis TaxID=1812482 RepID=A0ABS5LPX6_9BURK|nr:hypothetical protein [Comamonas sp. PE63]
MLCIFMLPLSGFCVSVEDIPDLIKSCEEEKTKDDYEIRGAPSCDLLRAIAEVQNGVLLPDANLLYEWNAALQMYCHYTKDKELVSCP